MITVADALNSLQPEAEWGIDHSNDDTLKWVSLDVPQPTDAEITAEISRLQAEYDATQYQRDRKVKYDALNQDEMRFDDLMNNTTTWQDAILAIKAEIPKPGEEP